MLPLIADANANITVFGSVRTTSPYCSLSLLISKPTLPARIDIALGIGVVAQILGPGNLESGWKYTLYTAFPSR